MIRLLVVAMLFAQPVYAGWFTEPRSHAECILEDMPRAKNSIAAQTVAARCLKRFPTGFNDESDRVADGKIAVDRCFKKHGMDTPDPLAAKVILAACQHIHGNLFDQ